MSRRVVRVAAALLLVLLAAVAWRVLGPSTVGGTASYVVTDGTSMLPRFRADGLVITRQQNDYRVGDVVAYHNRKLGVVVMHRIVARDGDRYVFKGDNNGFLDTYHPVAGDLVGKEWVYWPGAGRALKSLRSPGTFALVIGLLGGFAATAYVPRRNRRRRRHHAR